MQQIADWLEKLGLGQYAQRFAENGIDIAALPHLTDQDLRKSACCSGIGRPLDKLCQKLTAADIACDVMRNVLGHAECAPRSSGTASRAELLCGLEKR